MTLLKEEAVLTFLSNAIDISQQAFKYSAPLFGSRRLYVTDEVVFVVSFYHSTADDGEQKRNYFNPYHAPCRIAEPLVSGMAAARRQLKRLNVV